MPFEYTLYGVAALAMVAAVFSVLAFIRAGKKDDGAQVQQIVDAVRADLRALSQFVEANARGLRIELGSRIDTGIKTIDDKTDAFAERINSVFAEMGREAVAGRDHLRSLIEKKLEDAAEKQDAAAKESREEITSSFRKLGGDVRETLDRSTEEQKGRLEDLTKTFAVFSDRQEVAARESREETTSSFRKLGGDVRETLDRATEEQRARLDDVTKALAQFSDKQEKAQEALKEAVERRLDSIRAVNEAKLEEMRLTVDEKLQTTLETRLGQSFQLVSDQLQKVSSGLGEMQNLATGVGDLKRVLTQVKQRGQWGEAQLGSLLEDFLAPDQFARNVAVNPGSAERVEFAIRLPRLTDGHGEVYLPIDAKFPQDHYERLILASDSGDALAVEEAARGLERAIRFQAKDIASKYIVPPNTTDYAVMFLPSEALYSEVARRAGLAEAMSREFSIMIAGPSTLTALLNAIRVGFRSALIHQRAGEISKLLQKVRTEFVKYGEAVNTAAQRAAKTVDAIGKLQTRQNVMGRALKGIDLLAADSPADAATMFLDLETKEMDLADEAEAKNAQD